VQHLTQDELAKRWRMSPRTLEGWRSINAGPAYLKIVGRVIYRLVDVEAYEARHLCNVAMRRGPAPLDYAR
jgi:hypothetical protein